MIFIPLIIATTFMVMWFVLLFSSNQDDFQVLAYNKILDNREKINELRLKDELKLKKIEKYTGISFKILRSLHRKGHIKEIQKIEKTNEKIQGGNFSSISILDLPGYALYRKLEYSFNEAIRKKVYVNCLEYHGKNHVGNKMKEIFAKFLSYSIIGVALSLCIGTMVLCDEENFTIGLMILIIGPMISVLGAYSVYSGMNEKLRIRREAIQRQFPEVVSKLALLATSGTIMNKAWAQTAYSSNKELYIEMQKTSQELDNLITPEAAYSEFIRRCNTKETSKLATAIMQNLSKGNAEIGVLLKSMSKEAWVERRNFAKRDAEGANAKLLMPTMILLADILFMIMAPMLGGF